MHIYYYLLYLNSVGVWHINTFEDVDCSDLVPRCCINKSFGKVAAPKGLVFMRTHVRVDVCTYMHADMLERCTYILYSLGQGS